ncbi:hypothetical protein AN641_07710 [Candidatus Epulonipiscioides gigas]|nr:hypothetical protein AN641_07710 [Epulopiscium sp. SCG-C07WGA-EpuloA2]
MIIDVLMSMAYDILNIIPMILVAGIISFVCLCFIYKKFKLNKYSKFKILVTYVFIGWIIMFICVTQLALPPSGKFFTMNLEPFSEFFRWRDYGLKNGNFVGQYFLNIVMFIPLGIILPILFSNFKSYKKIFLFSFGLSLSTEFIQMITARSADIDDLLANTTGGLVGYGIYLIFIGLIALIPKFKYMKVQIVKYNTQLILGIIFIMLSVTPYLYVLIVPTNHIYGETYYGNHSVAKATFAENSIMPYQTTQNIYKLEQPTTDTIKNIMDMLSNVANKNLNYLLDGMFYRADENDKTISSIDIADGSYYIYLDAQIESNLTEDEAIEIGKQYLSKLNIDSNDIENVNVIVQDNEIDVYFRGLKQKEELLFYDYNIKITFNIDSNKIIVSNKTIVQTLVDTVEIVTPYEAFDIAQDLNDDNYMKWDVIIDNVFLEYEYILDTGYIIPVWNFEFSEGINLRLNEPIPNYDPSSDIIWHSKATAIDYNIM